MTFLAIDTSTDFLSIAVMKNSKIVSRYHKKSAMRHSSMLVPAIDRLLKKTRLKIGDIDCFAVSVGPGSFTGLRIGVATVKGLAYTLKKKIVAVPTLDVIARNVKNFRGVICPVLDARKDKIYACLYKSDGKDIKRLSKYLLLPAHELVNRLKKYDKIFLLGDAVDLDDLRGGIHSKIEIPPRRSYRFNWHPRAEVVAALGSAEFKNKKFVTPQDLEPMYLYSRECDITGK
jgi:tRNA threonylcarbamoyladenosine biosynthesis protein TsaB